MNKAKEKALKRICEEHIHPDLDYDSKLYDYKEVVKAIDIALEEQYKQVVEESIKIAERRNKR